MRSVCLERHWFTRFLFSVAIWFVVTHCSLVTWSAYALDQAVLPTTLYPVGMRQVEYVDPADGGRPLDYMLIYPAAPQAVATLFKIFLSTKLHLYKDAPWCRRIYVTKCALTRTPARDVRDDRVKAAFAMAPGDVQGFGMDEAGPKVVNHSAEIAARRWSRDFRQ
jgi:hypothetical protein